MPNLKSILKAGFPFLAQGLSMVGGPFGTMASNMIGQAVGINKPNPSEDDINAQLAKGITPDQIAALKKAENDFQLQAAQMGYADTESLEKIAADDRASARDREKSVRDYTPEIGFYLLAAIFAFFLHWLFKYPVPLDNKAIIYSAMGSLTTILITAATYFYGTTRGSEQKNQLLANSMPVKK